MMTALKSDAMTSLLTKLALGVATTATIGGGTAIIKNTSANAVQDQRISQLEKDREAMHELTQKLEVTNQNVAILNERLQHTGDTNGR